MLQDNSRAIEQSAAPLGNRKWLILATCCLSLFIVGIDSTIINVALPSIQRDFHASVSGLQWTVDAYSLVIACLLMASGSLADRFGRKRVFQIGLVLFGLGSLTCSVAPNLGFLVVSRAVQAVGGSMLNPVAMAIIVNTFTDRKERARAVGVWGSVVGVALATGPIVGGVLIDSVGWRSIFWINIPIGIAAIILTQKIVPESKAVRPRKIDVPAQALVIVMLASITYAVIEGRTKGWTSPTILGLFTISAVSLVAFILVELRRSEPLVDPRFYRSAPFAGASIIAVAGFGALGGFLFLNTLYLQDVRGYTALHAGLLAIPMALMITIFASISGKLVGSRGARIPFIVAGLTQTAAALLLTRLTVHTSITYLIAAYVIFGIGCGMLTAPVTSTAVAGMPIEQAGVAGAIASTCRQFGSAFGVAITGSIVAAGVGSKFVGASHEAWALIAGCGIVVFVVGLISSSSWAKESAIHNNERLHRRGEERIDEQEVASVA